MENKRGAEFTIGMLIAIVIGIVVLVIVIIGFVGGWNNLLDKLNIFGGGDDLGSVGQTCALACSAGNTNGFCKTGRDVKGLTDADLGKLGTFDSTNNKLALSAGGNLKVGGNTNDREVDGLTCSMLKTANLIDLGECTAPTCA
jgi:hypothetical protein